MSVFRSIFPKSNQILNSLYHRPVFIQDVLFIFSDIFGISFIF